MVSYLSVECFVCGEFTNLHRCGLLLSPSTKRRPTKKHSLCDICYYKLRRLAELVRGEAMNSLVLLKYSEKTKGICTSSFEEVMLNSVDGRRNKTI
ncbi:MAG: hypothetical protein FJ356_03640 [Thaumarchaeota archaeon]|nr:hypothetical protein [Nitrososphaerota archaeon]